jgi:AcrR family transcriptional regulator
MAAGRPALRERAVAAALDLAGETGWADLRMHMIADRLGVPLGDLAREFRDLDAIANAWFARVLETALDVAAPEMEGLTAAERLLRVVGAWFDALEPHAAVSREMLRLKLHPSHPHHWVPMAFDLSRLMHWFLDAARIEGSGARRALQEIAITGLFLGALARWAWPGPPRAGRARRHFERRLRLVATLFADRPRRGPATA